MLANEVDPWTALGEPTRRAIFVRVTARPQSVGELAEELPVSRPAVSQHLKVLKRAGLVAVDAVGTRRIYRVEPAGLRALRRELETFWNQTLANFKHIVEQPTEEDG